MDISIPTEIDRLCRILPKLENLSLLTHDRAEILEVVNALSDLKTAVFRWPLSREKSIDISKQWLEENQMTFRLSRQNLDLWIN